MKSDDVTFETEMVAEPNDKANGSKIREYRKDADMKQQELADALGVHKSHLCDMEFGKRRMSKEVFDNAKDAIRRHRSNK